MAHQITGYAKLVEGAVTGGHHVVVDRLQLAPRRRGLRDVGWSPAVEQEVANVRRVELLLVVQLAGAPADAQPAVALDDPLAELALGGHVVGASLVADEREAHRVQVPAPAPEERLKRLRLDAVGATTSWKNGVLHSPRFEASAN